MKRSAERKGWEEKCRSEGIRSVDDKGREVKKGRKNSAEGKGRFMQKKVKISAEGKGRKVQKRSAEGKRK